jgi:hypothetical protein
MLPFSGECRPVATSVPGPREAAGTARGVAAPETERKTKGVRPLQRPVSHRSRRLRAATTLPGRGLGAPPSARPERCTRGIDRTGSSGESPLLEAERSCFATIDLNFQRTVAGHQLFHHCLHVCTRMANAGLSRTRERVGSSPELERACYTGFSTIFQYESFLRTFPSRNSQWSHPRTRTRRPSGVVPVRSHSETPRLPVTQCRSSL